MWYFTIWLRNICCVYNISWKINKSKKEEESWDSILIKKVCRAELLLYPISTKTSYGWWQVIARNTRNKKSGDNCWPNIYTKSCSVFFCGGEESWNTRVFGRREENRVPDGGLNTPLLSYSMKRWNDGWAANCTETKLVCRVDTRARNPGRRAIYESEIAENRQTVPRSSLFSAVKFRLWFDLFPPFPPSNREIREIY